MFDGRDPLGVAVAKGNRQQPFQSFLAKFEGRVGLGRDAVAKNRQVIGIAIA